MRIVISFALFLLCFSSCASLFLLLFDSDAPLDSIEILQDECSECANAAILIVLRDAPAYIRKGCFGFFNRVDSFAVELVNKPSGINHLIYPCGGVPENFRIDGLSVLVSGNILDCRRFNQCFAAPNVRLAAQNILELKTIRRR